MSPLVFVPSYGAVFAVPHPGVDTMTHAERVLQLLSDGQPHTHMEGYRLGVMLHSRVSDLRRKGYAIRCWRDGDDYLYQLIPAEVVRQPETTDGGLGASLAIGPPESESTPGDFPSPGAAEAPPGTDLLPRGPQSPVVLRQPTLWEAA